MVEDPYRRSTDAAPASPAAAVNGGRPLGQRLAHGLWMHWETARNGDRVLVRVTGEIDLDAAGPLDEALERALDASGSGLDVDLSGVSFCNSTGLNTLLDLRVTAHHGGRDVVLTAVSEVVRRLLVLTDTLDLFVSAPAPDGGGGRPEGDLAPP
ncbi:STAS domain-containing protein [Kitasatospora sp. NPDC005748]|uniref:STAS domain-containing protein n=1 Tax=Kitasatospora sp. NPDC005748 TaxID=3157063 RepID=UPI0033D6D672